MNRSWPILLTFLEHPRDGIFYVVRLLRISKMLVPLESIIEGTLIQALVGIHNCSGELRQVFALPARCGGLGLIINHQEADFEYENSKIMMAQLTEAIFQQQTSFLLDETKKAEASKLSAKRNTEKHAKQFADATNNVRMKNLGQHVGAFPIRNASAVLPPVWTSHYTEFIDPATGHSIQNPTLDVAGVM